MRKKKKGKGKGKKKKKKKIFPFTGFVIVVVENKYEVVGAEKVKIWCILLLLLHTGCICSCWDNKSGGSDRKKENKTHTHTSHDNKMDNGWYPMDI